LDRVARPRKENRPLPPPLPHAERTVGQLVAEALRLYGRRFWASLLVGVGPALLGVAGTALSGTAAVAATATVGAVVLAGAFLLAIRVAHEPEDAPWMTGLVAGVLVFAPFAVLVQFFVFPGLLWLALVGLTVPAIVVERLGLVDGFRRGLGLARADFVHAFGGFAALGLVVILTYVALVFVLRGQAEQTLRTAGLLASLVLSPVFFLGAALLYADNAARVVHSGTRKPRTRRGDADLHPAVDADRPGRPDAQVESGTAARGEP
jgi:hypothetical protein